MNWCLPVPVAARSKAWIYGRSLAGIVSSNPAGGVGVCVECCVLSGRGLCDGLITRPEKSYRLWRVVVCDLETSRMRRPWPALVRSATVVKNKMMFKWCWNGYDNGRLCHDQSGYSPPSYLGDPGSIPCLSVCGIVAVVLVSLWTLRFCPVFVIPPMLRTYLHVALFGIVSGRSLRTVKSSSDLPQVGKIW